MYESLPINKTSDVGGLLKNQSYQYEARSRVQSAAKSGDAYSKVSSKIQSSKKVNLAS